MSFLETTMGFCPMKCDYFLERWQSIFYSAIFVLTSNTAYKSFSFRLFQRKVYKIWEAPLGGLHGSGQWQGSSFEQIEKVAALPLAARVGQGGKPPQI